MDQLTALATALPAHDGAGHVLIIGGGASGVLMAAQILKRSGDLRVTIVEGAHLLGCGIAYSTHDPDHLLNTRVHNMSAFPDDPEHFMRWLQDRPEGQGVTAQCFVSRETYGAYMSDLLRPWTTGPEARRLSCLRRNCIRIEEGATGVTAHLDGGEALTGDLAVLATGHVLAPPDPQGLTVGAWDGVRGIDPDGRVVIVGSGLSMVDQVLSLVKSGHRGPIVSVSRRGQLPRPHAPTTPMRIEAADLPLGAPLSQIFRWARRLARQAEADGGTWRDAVDGLRPHVSAFWQAMDVTQRARFLRHVVAWWDVHRHRIPAASAKRIAEAMARGQLTHERGNFLNAEMGADGGLVAVIRPYGAHDEVRIEAAKIIDCRGIRNDPERNATPLMADLLARGKARVDPLHIGLDVTTDCRLIDAQGRVSDRVMAIGPVSRAAFWEITAIPDIREQVATRAAAITEALQIRA